MWKKHCDICDRDMTKDENQTKVTWEDNNGYEAGRLFVLRAPRKFSADICDECLAKIRNRGGE